MSLFCEKLPFIGTKCCCFQHRHEEGVRWSSRVGQSSDKEHRTEQLPGEMNPELAYDRIRRTGLRPQNSPIKIKEWNISFPILAVFENKSPHYKGYKCLKIIIGVLKYLL